MDATDDDHILTPPQDHSESLSSYIIYLLLTSKSRLNYTSAPHHITSLLFIIRQGDSWDTLLHTYTSKKHCQIRKKRVTTPYTKDHSDEPFSCVFWNGCWYFLQKNDLGTYAQRKTSSVTGKPNSNYVFLYAVRTLSLMRRALSLFQSDRPSGCWLVVLVLYYILVLYMPTYYIHTLPTHMSNMWKYPQSIAPTIRDHIVWWKPRVRIGGIPSQRKRLRERIERKFAYTARWP